MKKIRTRLAIATRGAAMVEYVVLAGMVSVVSILAVSRVGGEVDSVFTAADARLTRAIPIGDAASGGGGSVGTASLPPQLPFEFDTYPAAGTEIYTVETGGAAYSSFRLDDGVEGLEITDDGVIRVIDAAEFTPFGTGRTVEVTAVSPAGETASASIEISRRDASDPEQWWDIVYAYDRVEPSGTSFSATSGSALADEAQLNCAERVAEWNLSADPGTSYTMRERRDEDWYSCEVMTRTQRQYGPGYWPLQNESASSEEYWYLEEFADFEGTFYPGTRAEYTRENFEIVEGPFRIDPPW